mmetsp:Transcript_13793/g.25943  ORF Transcript_13793/g.25943 Transcript_13793/m.25943 type:complete len:241 (-) Transcript_13793:1636-2358(-)
MSESAVPTYGPPPPTPPAPPPSLRFRFFLFMKSAAAITPTTTIAPITMPAMAPPAMGVCSFALRVLDGAVPDPGCGGGETMTTTGLSAGNKAWSRPSLMACSMACVKADRVAAASRFTTARVASDWTVWHARPSGEPVGQKTSCMSSIVGGDSPWYVTEDVSCRFLSATVRPSSWPFLRRRWPPPSPPPFLAPSPPSPRLSFLAPSPNGNVSATTCGTNTSNAPVSSVAYVLRYSWASMP